MINESVGVLGKEGLSSTARVAESFANSAVDVITHSLGKEAGSVAAGGLKFAQDLAAQTIEGPPAESKASDVDESKSDETMEAPEEGEGVAETVSTEQKAAEEK
mmetsp:Transcript_6738/g.13374  ORF Transcript_6738/g.13374 Transcript_6738/m.13374 type:complete len:104 (-) Transcript_6738:447-758(-)